MDLELFGAIDADSSSWSFGSVGTVRFTLAKAEPGEWKRLTRSQEPIRNHRVWWEHQDKVQAEDRARRKVEKDERDKVDRAEREAKEEEERAQQQRAQADAKATARAAQLEAVTAAVVSLEALLALPGQQDLTAEGAAAGGTGVEAASAALADVDGAPGIVELGEAAASAEGSLQLSPLEASFASGLAALEAVGQGSNATAVAHARHLVSSAHALSATDFPVSRKTVKRDRNAAARISRGRTAPALPPVRCPARTVEEPP
jgi:hypothetical protein